VIEYLEDVDPAAAERARTRYECLSRFGEDGQQYGMATRLGLTRACTDDVVKQLLDLLGESERYRIISNGKTGEERFFDAEQNSRLVVAAEDYYRQMLRDDVSSWNLRDEHMADTISRIRDHLKKINLPPKVIVWAHNSHIGDARHTDMSWRREELNIGQLCKQTYGTKAFSIGFTTYNGTVTAASKWGRSPFRKKVRNGLHGSYEDLFHQTGNPRFLLDFRGNAKLTEMLSQPMMERAIGVLYLPETERRSHYFDASISKQFDALIHLDHTRAVEPTRHEHAWEHLGQTPETYPTGI
jgi:erythromycin esterase-like protein